MSHWILLETGFRSARFHMDLDAALFREAEDDPERPPVLRVYGFRPPAMTYGFFAELPDFDWADSRYDHVKRLTGGGVVAHGVDLTYSVVARKDEFPAFRYVRTAYRAFHEVICNALAALGIPVEFAAQRSGQRGERDARCFEAAVENDLLFRGVKISGAAEKRSGLVFLHQGSVDLAPFLADLAQYPDLYGRFRKVFLEAFRAFFDAAFVIQSGFNGRDQRLSRKTADDCRAEHPLQARSL